MTSRNLSFKSDVIPPNHEQLAQEFPGVFLKWRGECERPEGPWVFEYEVWAPTIEQMKAFVMKYGSADLKEMVTR